jgi:cytochrome c-type biogenesis protein CcmH/NrfG
VYGRRFTELCAWIIFAVAAFPRVGAGQESPVDPVRAAVERRNAGDLTGAVQLLRHRLDEAPSDAQAIRLLAQTLYWLKQFDHARSMYDTALTRHPDNVAIRLEYARMLATSVRSQRRGSCSPPSAAPPLPKRGTCCASSRWRRPHGSESASKPP